MIRLLASQRQRLRRPFLASLWTESSSKKKTSKPSSSRHIGIDLAQPHLWYSDARRLKRRIHLHVGPTNSGKTYQALQALMSHPARGIYCGPLRLLAWEICEKIRDAGLLCSLVTGQEIDIQQDEDFPHVPAHKSCTIEMADLKSRFDIAVIDEGQLLGDKSRGWAWTQAFLGLQAQELHICGSDNLVEIVEKMAQLCGDEIVKVNSYTRLSPLHVSTRAVESFRNILPGDCIVAFQRSRLYEIKSLVERQNPHLRCCVVYGSLPPETRRAQAQLFSDPHSGFNILVASDAIGMGLNLKINRIVFSALEKFDGRERRHLTAGEIKQIAGRAGRYRVGGHGPDLSVLDGGDGQGQGEGDGAGEGGSVGIATCMAADDLSHIRRGLQVSLPRVRRAGLFPSLEQLELLGVFIDFQINERVLRDFWSDKIAREWGADADGINDYQHYSTSTAATADDATSTSSKSSDDEVLRALINQRIQDCSSAASVIKYFGSVSNFSRELELFIYDSSTSGGDDDDYQNDSSGGSIKGSSQREEEASASRKSNLKRIKRIERLRRRSHDSHYSHAYPTQVDQHGRSDSNSSNSNNSNNSNSSNSSNTNNVRAPLAASLTQLLETFREVCAVDQGKVFFLCDLDERLAIATLLDDVKLSFRDKYVISMAPVNVEDEELKIYFRRFASDKASYPHIALLDDLAPQSFSHTTTDNDNDNDSDANNSTNTNTKPNTKFNTSSHNKWQVPTNPSELLRLETKHKIFDLYLWLGQRFPHNFPQQKEAKKQADECSRLISLSLVTLGQMEVERKYVRVAGRKQREREREREKERRSGRRRERWGELGEDQDNDHNHNHDQQQQQRPAYGTRKMKAAKRRL